jgi:hypothetical protein
MFLIFVKINGKADKKHIPLDRPTSRNLLIEKDLCHVKTILEIKLNEEIAGCVPSQKVV